MNNRRVISFRLFPIYIGCYINFLVFFFLRQFLSSSVSQKINVFFSTVADSQVELRGRAKTNRLKGNLSGKKKDFKADLRKQEEDLSEENYFKSDSSKQEKESGVKEQLKILQEKYQKLEAELNLKKMKRGQKREIFPPDDEEDHEIKVVKKIRSEKKKKNIITETDTSSDDDENESNDVNLGNGIRIKKLAYQEAQDVLQPSRFISTICKAIYTIDELATKTTRKTAGLDRALISPEKKAVIKSSFKKWLKSNFSKERRQLEVLNINSYINRATDGARKKQKRDNAVKNDQ